MPHRRLLLALALSLLALVAISVSVVGLTRDPSSPAPAAESLLGGRRPPGIPPRPFALRDERGRMIRLDSLRGRSVVLLFACTTCGQAAALAAQQIRAALDAVPAAAALAVSTGPRGDTPARVRAFLRRLHLRGRVPYLTGAPARLRRVWRDYAVQRGAVSVVVLDRAGVQRAGFGATDDLTPEALAHDLRVLGRAP